jgi:hypothetical protein
MALTPKQAEKARATLQATMSTKCQWCGKKQWAIGPIVTHAQWNDGPVLGGEHVPLLLVFCMRCGQVLQFSAVQMGLLPGEDKR